MIQHILFPTDGSEASHKALKYLISLAQQYQARVSLVHTYDFAMGQMMARYGAETGALQDLEEHLSQAGEQLLKELTQELVDAGLIVSAAFNQKGDAGHWIITLAEQEDCDLILMGTRGMGALKSALLGSTSHFVVNHSHRIPVFLIPIE